MPTPQITLTANLQTILAGAGEAGYLQVTLCGFGPIMPAVAGTAMLADAGIPQLIGPQVGVTPLSTLIYGNDVITPAGTFYCVGLLDANQNVIQSGNYQFTGAGTRDLSQAAQIVGPYGFQPSALQYLPCTGVVPGTNYTAPGTVVAVFYNGNALRTTLDFTSLGRAIALNFATEIGDSIYALCIANS